jgi:hypothetical protein
VLLAKEQSLPILKVLGFDVAGTSRAQTHDLPDAEREHYHYHRNRCFAMMKESSLLLVEVKG